MTTTRPDPRKDREHGICPRCGDGEIMSNPDSSSAGCSNSDCDWSAR